VKEIMVQNETLFNRHPANPILTSTAFLMRELRYCQTGLLCFSAASKIAAACLTCARRVREMGSMGGKSIVHQHFCRILTGIRKSYGASKIPVLLMSPNSSDMQ
jgi:ribosomal protein S27E